MEIEDRTTVSRRVTLAGLLVVAVGIILRLRAYQINFSLWLDEASLALNLLVRSFVELTKPLAYYQAAPVLFLWLEKVVLVVTRSSSEYALRAVPLLAGAAACLCFWMLCRYLKLNAAATLAATVLFSISGKLIYYSCQAKQYSTDVLASVGIYLAASIFMRKPSARNGCLYASVGLVSIGLSHPSVFVLAGVGAVILVDGLRRHDQRMVWVQSAVILVWLAAFAIDYLFFLRHVSEIPGMHEFWQLHFGFMPRSRGAIQWLGRSARAVAYESGYNWKLLVPAALAGTILSFRRDWRIPLMLWIPVVLAISASAFGIYPFAHRMMLFATPAVLLSAGAAFAVIVDARRWYYKVLFLGAFCCLTLAPAKSALALFPHPERFGTEDFRDVFLLTDGSGKCGNHIFVYESAANHYRYYSRFRWREKPIVPLVFNSQLAGGEADQTPKMSGYLAEPTDQDPSYFDHPACFWIVFSQAKDSEIAQAREILLTRGYRETSAIYRVGAESHLFQRHDSPRTN